MKKKDWLKKPKLQNRKDWLKNWLKRGDWNRKLKKLSKKPHKKLKRLNKNDYKKLKRQREKNKNRLRQPNSLS